MRRAFVMGSNGPNGSSQLKYALDDVVRISAALSDPRCGFQVDNPDSDYDIWSIYRDLNNAADLCTVDDTFICYFSGHGRLQNGSLFLLWHKSDADRLNNTALSIARIMESLSHCKAQNKLLILDCCHAGAVVNMPKDGDEIKIDNVVIKPENYLILMASDRFEQTREFEELQGGFLTVNICDAISEKLDEADLDGDGRISIFDLKKWLEQRLTPHNEKLSEMEQVPVPYLYGQYKGEFFLTLPHLKSDELSESSQDNLNKSMSSLSDDNSTSFCLENIVIATKKLLKTEQNLENRLNFYIEYNNLKEIREEIRKFCNDIYKELDIDGVIYKLVDNTFAAYILLYLKDSSSQQKIPISVAIKDPITKQYKIDQAVGRKVSRNEVEQDLNHSELHDSYFGQWLLQDPALLSEGFSPLGVVTELHEEETEFAALDEELEFNNSNYKPLVYVLKIPGQCQEEEILNCKQIPLANSIGYNVVENDSQKGQAYRQALINLSKNIGVKGDGDKPGYFGQKLEIGEILFLPIRRGDNLKLNLLIMTRKKKIPRDLASILLFRRCADLLYTRLSEYFNQNYQTNKDK